MNTNIFMYQLYGLIIKSEIELPELCATNTYKNSNSNLVNISLGSTPRFINHPIFTTTWWQISKKEFYMYIKDVGHYYVSNGTSIIIEPDAGSDIDYIKVFLLGSALGLLMFQRNILAIHGGTIEIGGQGIILTGQTGAGKSTLNSAFRKEGYNFLSDDVSALGKDETKNIVIHPAYPHAKLCSDTMIKLGYNLDNFNLLIDQKRKKYSVPLGKTFVNHNVRLLRIYEISEADVECVEIIEVLGIEKIKLLLRNIYRIEISKYLGLDSNYINQCLDIAQNIPVYKLIRPSNKFSVNEQMEQILRSLNCVNNEMTL